MSCCASEPAYYIADCRISTFGTYIFPQPFWCDTLPGGTVKKIDEEIVIWKSVGQFQEIKCTTDNEISFQSIFPRATYSWLSQQDKLIVVLIETENSINKYDITNTTWISGK